MSKKETPATRLFWKEIGGTLSLEFRAVSRTKARGQRLLDGLVIPDGPAHETHWRDVDVTGRNIVIIQTKAERLGMYLLGQAFFSRELMKKYFEPRSIRTVALCKSGDEYLEGIAADHGVEVVIRPEYFIG